MTSLQQDLKQSLVEHYKCRALKMYVLKSIAKHRAKKQAAIAIEQHRQSQFNVVSFVLNGEDVFAMGYSNAITLRINKSLTDLATLQTITRLLEIERKYLYTIRVVDSQIEKISEYLSVVESNIYSTWCQSGGGSRCARTTDNGGNFL